MIKNILILENDIGLRQTFEGFLKSQTGFLNVLTSQDTNDALHIIEQLRIHILVIGFQVPEIEGFNLVSHLNEYHPDIRIIVMMDNASPLFRASFKSLDSPIYFEKISDINLLSQRIFAELKIQHGGHINGVSLSSLLQMMEMEKNTCTLQVRTKNIMGYLYLKNGTLLSAKFNSKTGLTAALEILSWKNVTIEIDYSTPRVNKDITMPIMSLILEAFRLADEKETTRPNLRKHERHDCMIPVNYDLQDWSNQCLLWDISLGGAYIETNQAISVGKILMVTLYTPDQTNKCKVEAKVVRRDNKGVGISFENITAEQSEIIKSLAMSRLADLSKDSDLPVYVESEIKPEEN